MQSELPKLVSNSRVSRGDELANRAVNQHKLTPCGMAAFKAACDPFHDNPIRDLGGWPDRDTHPSVVRRFKKSTTVSNFELGGALMVYSWPIENLCRLSPCARRNAIIDSITDPAVSTDGYIAPVCIYQYGAAAAAASSLIIAGTGVTTFQHSVEDDYFKDGPSRLIGLGFEVHDVSAEILKQGTITLFEVPQDVSATEVIQTKQNTVSGFTRLPTSANVVDLSRPPANQADMMTYPTSKQWEAKDGAYVVIPFTGHENPAKLAEYLVPYVNEDSQEGCDYPNNDNHGGRLIGDWLTGGTSPDNYVFNANSYAPMHSRGVLITGLQELSTFTVTTSFYYETFPVNESPLIPLASPSCEFDPRALALISTAMKNLPVGCKVADNFDGDWFWNVLEQTLPTIGTVASAFFPEFAPLIAPATVLGKEALAKKNAKRKKQNKQAKQKMAQDMQHLIKEERRILDQTAQRQKQISRMANQSLSGKLAGAGK